MIKSKKIELCIEDMRIDLKRSINCYMKMICRNIRVKYSVKIVFIKTYLTIKYFKYQYFILLTSATVQFFSIPTTLKCKMSIVVLQFKK